jgi:hypothetical protein|tara:strand:- start:370 stop:519 length:150 start_codon:yes stop_codon:yes gene_type:complete
LEVAGLDGSQSVKNIFGSNNNGKEALQQNIFKNTNEWPQDVDTARKEDY